MKAMAKDVVVCPLGKLVRPMMGSKGLENSKLLGRCRWMNSTMMSRIAPDITQQARAARA